ncbi:L-xylulose reductase [Folsomia candida]|uniref:L-xylulose reductase n=1 Tax=Folsomia candida TaxID=158441 RepID=UPI0016051C48|nr:L-xylulose reductase [Folsomia candida]
MAFKDKKVIITGAAGNIGRALVDRFLASGAIIFAVDKAQDGLDALQRQFPNVRICNIDLMDWEATREGVDALGPVHYLINNAGLVIAESFLEMKLESIDLSLGVHFKGALNVSQVVVKNMIKAGIPGSIVNVSSVASFRASTKLGAYSTSKAAMDMLTKVMAVELGEHKIRVNSINPSVILTEMAQKLPQNDNFMTRTPLKRIARIDEVVNAILFTLGDECPIMTGNFLTIDGGYSISAN